MNATRKMPTNNHVFNYWKARGVSSKSKRHCFLCHREADGNIERAHIIPRCDGGSDDVSNIHLLCHSCHRLTEYHICSGKYWAFFMDPSSVNIALNWPLSYALASEYAPPPGYDVADKLRELANG